MSTPRIGRRPDTQLAPDEQPRHEELPPIEVTRRESERAAIAEALRVPPPAPAPAVDTPDPVLPPPPPALSDEHDSVARALDDQAAALKAVENAKAELAAANARVEQAKERAAAQARVRGLAEAQRVVTPLVQDMRHRRAAFLELARQYGSISPTLPMRGPLGEISKTNISDGSVQQRNRLLELQPLATKYMNRIAQGYQAADKAITLCEKALRSGDGFAVEIAVKAGDSARAHDAATLGKEIAAYIAEVKAVRGGALPSSPALPEIRITIEPETDWRRDA